MTKTMPLGNQKKTLRTVKIKLENLRKRRKELKMNERLKGKKGPKRDVMRVHQNQALQLNVVDQRKSKAQTGDCI